MSRRSRRNHSPTFKAKVALAVTKGERTLVMDASNLTFPENTFDLVFGSGIVHHPDTRQSAQEVSRVLRPGRNAVFAEPMGSNPLINLYRKMTPNVRTPGEHPLVTTDLKIMRQYFRSVETTYFGLTALAAMPLRTTNVGTTVRGLFEAIDTGIFAVPGLNRLAGPALSSAPNSGYCHNLTQSTFMFWPTPPPDVELLPMAFS